MIFAFGPTMKKWRTNGVRGLYRLVGRNSVVENYKEDVPKIDVCIIRARLIEIPALKGSDPASPSHP